MSTRPVALTPTSPLHSERVAAILGVALAITFTTCFLTGLTSHLAQDPPSWLSWPTRPAGLYRITQGVHIATGLASIPLLLAKLWTVFPKLFVWPPFRSAAEAVERLLIVPLVGGAVFMLFTGLANINLWYPWPFNFRRAHYWVAWVTIGALVAHIGAKWRTSRRALRREAAADESAEIRLDRRRFLIGTFGAGAAVTLFTVGQTVGPLRAVALLAPRRPDVGPQGFPVNRTAVDAGVVRSAQADDFRLIVDGRVARPLSLTLAEVAAMPQHEAVLPIACVEGWSASRRWRGVQVRALLRAAGAGPDAEVRVHSLQERRAYRTSDLDTGQAHDSDTLLALEVEGEPLHLDHGAPMRLIGPNRPGVLQTKWVTRLEVR